MFDLRNAYHAYDGSDWARLEARPERPIPGILVEDLRIPVAGVTAVIGPSGSGKTTLLSMLAGFLPADLGPEGHLLFRGRPIPPAGHPAGNVAFVFQSSMLLGAANAAVNMLQGRIAAGRETFDRGEVLEMRVRMRQLGLVGADQVLIAKRSRDLSGGEKQRVAILRALLADPAAVLCDEPTSSLDEFNADRALSTLRSWAETTGRPVIWVTHDLPRAARFAHHFVFVSRGRHAPLPIEAQSALEQSTGDARLEKLRRIARDLGFRTDPELDPLPAASPQAGAGPAPQRLSRGRYLRWIAQALSSDSPPATAFEAGRDAALAPVAQQRLISALDPDYSPPPASFVGRLVRRVASYSGYGLALVLFVLALQIFAADLGGKLARAYSEARLQDPAVARIVFDHAIFALDEPGGAAAPDLYPGAAIEELRLALQAGLRDRAPLADAAQVRVFGRRIIDGSALTFRDVPEACSRPVQLTTIALDRRDPILRQAVFDGSDPALVPAPDALGLAGEADLFGAPRPKVMVTQDLVDLLRERCGLAPGAPILADWQAGLAGQGRPLLVEVAASVARFPPLYPHSPQMLVFEEDFQAAASLFERFEPGPFRVASAYFPIEGFAAVDAVLRERGYRPRDDSAAAVATLQSVAQAAETIPAYVIGFNLAGCMVVYILVIGAILELNKRVLALFTAHGFRRVDVVVMTALHLAPAAAVAIGLLALLLALFWSTLAALVPAEVAGAGGLAAAAFARTAALVWGAGLVVVVVVVLIWWTRTRANQKAYLQE